jgi:flagellar biosynthesis protein FliQ
MTSKQISVGVGIPMIIVGTLLAVLLAPTQIQIKDTIEFIGSLIGILGVLIFIAGLFVITTPKITS